MLISVLTDFVLLEFLLIIILTVLVLRKNRLRLTVLLGYGVFNLFMALYNPSIHN